MSLSNLVVALDSLTYQYQKKPLDSEKVISLIDKIGQLCDSEPSALIFNSPNSWLHNFIPSEFVAYKRLKKQYSIKSLNKQEVIGRCLSKRAIDNKSIIELLLSQPSQTSQTSQDIIKTLSANHLFYLKQCGGLDFYSLCAKTKNYELLEWALEKEVPVQLKAIKYLIKRSKLEAIKKVFSSKVFADLMQDNICYQSVLEYAVQKNSRPVLEQILNNPQIDHSKLKQINDASLSCALKNSSIDLLLINLPKEFLYNKFYTSTDNDYLMRCLFDYITSNPELTEQRICLLIGPANAVNDRLMSLSVLTHYASSSLNDFEDKFLLYFNALESLQKKGLLGNEKTLNQKNETISLFACFLSDALGSNKKMAELLFNSNFTKPPSIPTVNALGATDLSMLESIKRTTKNPDSADLLIASYEKYKLAYSIVGSKKENSQDLARKYKV